MSQCEVLPKGRYLVPGESDEARLTIAMLVEEIAALNLDIEDAVLREDLLDIYDNEVRIAQGEQARTMPGFHESNSDDKTELANR